MAILQRVLYHVEAINTGELDVEDGSTVERSIFIPDYVLQARGLNPHILKAALP